MYKLLSTLKRIEAENCIFLTYNLDLPFFESGLFEPLYGYGCRNTIVICDPRQYEMALEDAPLLRYAGQRYLVFPGQTSKYGAFHPKLILLTSKTQGHLYVLSGNLTQAGFTSNWEVLTEFTFDTRKPDPITWKAFRWAFDTIKKIVSKSDTSDLANDRIERLWGSTPWLRERIAATENTSVWMLDNLSLPILDQIESLYRIHDKHPIQRAIAISPYFDYEARAFEALLARFQPKAVDIYTQESPPINPKALNNVLKNFPTKFTINELPLQRRLHAKVLLLQSQETVWLASGSANLSAPALLHPSQLGNTEIMVLRHEPDPRYFDDWLDELIHEAVEINWKEISAIQATTPSALQKSQMRLEVAQLNGFNLELKVLPTPSVGSNLIINLNIGQILALENKVREVQTDGWIKVSISRELSERLTVPTIISVIEVSTKSETIQSNYVLLHNLPALERYSKPPHNPNRPKVPLGLSPDNDSDYVWILDMIQDLLITNHEQLKRYNPHIVAGHEDESKEETTEIEEEYNPTDHIVSERVRSVSSSSASDDLYSDYDKRWTYQEILNAVLAVTYSQKFIREKNKIEELSEKELDKNKKSNPDTPVHNIENEDHLRLKRRISSGFRRLVENFKQGLADEKYLASIPPNYLLELWLIITRYLQNVWKNNLLDKEIYYDMSLDMFFSFWGKPAELGAWEIIKNRFSPSELQTEYQRLSIPLNAWLFASLLFQLLEADNNSSRFDLAGWMRVFTKQVAPPDALSKTDEETYKRAWDSNFPKYFSFMSLSNLIESLNNASHQYDDDSVKDEIYARTGYVPFIEYDKIADLIQVPKLILRMPLTDTMLEQCLQLFLLFILAGKNRSTAWVRVENINPLIADEDIRSVTIFFHNDAKTFDFAVERLEKHNYRPDYSKSGITLKRLKQIKNLSEIEKM